MIEKPCETKRKRKDKAPSTYITKIKYQLLMPIYWYKQKCKVMFKDQDIALPKDQVFISILFNLKKFI